MNSAKEKSEAAPLKAAITLANLKHTLKVVGMAIERKTTIPILSCVRMEQLAAGLAIEATDLDTSIRAIMVSEPHGPKLPIVMPAEHFMEWTKLLDGDEVKISATDRRATLQCGRARAVLPVLNAAQWPCTGEAFEMAGTTAISFTQGSFARALRFALISMSTEESRYVINGILLEGDGQYLRMVSTNGHCLMKYTLPCEQKIKLLLPAPLIKNLLPLLVDEDGGVDLSFNKTAILATVKINETRFFISAHVLSGAFPSYDKVVPSDPRLEVTANASDLLASLERCLLLSDENSGCIRLTFDKQITIDASSAMGGEARETVDCQGCPENPLTIGVNGEFLINLVKKLDGEVRIALPPDNTKPLLFKAAPHEDETLGYVVMPMRF
jgi:DNA polymerase-3 subunit beta